MDGGVGAVILGVLGFGDRKPASQLDQADVFEARRGNGDHLPYPVASLSCEPQRGHAAQRIAGDVEAIDLELIEHPQLALGEPLKGERVAVVGRRDICAAGR